MEQTLGKPHYILQEDLQYEYHREVSTVKKGTEYIFNGLAFSPKEFNSETNGGWTLSEEFIVNSGIFHIKD